MEKFTITMKTLSVQKKVVIANNEDEAIEIANSEDWHEKEEILWTDFESDASEYEEDNYPFNQGDDYYTIEDGKVIKSCWDDVSESDHDENPNRIYFAYEDSAIRYLKLGH